jgi:catecholate siderophore receptor
MTDRTPTLGLWLFAGALAAAGPALAVEPGVGPEDDQARSQTLPGVDVIGRRARSSVQTLPTAVEDTPQMVNVISERLLEQQNATTLAEALRNVPGITIAIGEGNGGLNGDQFRIRGLEAKDDLYIDGLRDFGVYTRDAFNYEQIEVLKGPSGATAGRGAGAGAINTTSKSPRLRDFTEVTAGVGSADYGRLTLDWNRALGDSAALRLNLMATRADMADRDLVRADRWGVAPSLAWGVGTETEFRLGYLHQQGEGRPDYGVPVVAPNAATLGRPVTELGVNRSNFYGYDSDLDDTTADVLTLRIDHALADGVSIASSTRLGRYDRDFGSTAGSCGATVPAGAPVGTLPCLIAFFDNDPATRPFVSPGAPAGYVQDSRGVQTLLTALIVRPLAGRRNELVVGLDLSAQENTRDLFNFSGAVGSGNRPPLDLFDPDNSFINIRQATPTSSRVSKGRDYSIFASNQLWLTDAWSVVAGLRLQRYEADYTTITYAPAGETRTELSAASDLLNPKASLIWEPTSQLMAYASWARSATPVGTSVTNAPNSIGSAALSELEPEENETFETGLKATVFGNLLFQGSVFQIDKTNAKETDGLGTIVSSGDAQRVRGVELALNGSITPAWTLYANLTRLDAEITDSTTTANIGRTVQFVPETAVSLWSAYEWGPLTLGAGVTWQDEMFLNAANSAAVPASHSIDALVSWTAGPVKLQLNAYNLTDELNYSQVWSNRVVPSPGRTAVLTLTAAF